MDSTFLKSASRTLIALLFAIIVSYYFFRSEKFWIPLATLLVMQTPIGSELHHGLQRFLVMLASLAVGSFLVLFVQQKIVIDILVLCCFLASAYFYKDENFILSLGFLASLLILITVLLPYHSLQMRAYAVTVGSIIGMTAKVILFPARPDVEFRKRIITLLKAYNNYLLTIKQLLLREPNAESQALQQRIIVETILLKKAPVWVYQSGFNFALRQGHRYFFIMVERIGQLLMTLHSEARHEFDGEVRQLLSTPFNQYVLHVGELFAVIESILSLKKETLAWNDCAEDITAMENAFNTTVTPSLELLDISKDYSTFAALILDLKDLRDVLLKLLEALQNT